MRTLDVWLGNKLVGKVKENRKGGRFSYLPEIVEQYAGAPILSLSLPVKSRPFSETKTRNWFEGLLPEGQRRLDVCHSLELSEYDWIGLLGEIGWECAGAVRIFEEGTVTEHPADYHPLSHDELAKKLSDTSARMPHRTDESFRMSLGGFQEKMCVCMPHFEKGTRLIQCCDVLLPKGDAPSTHILKPENVHDYPGCAESETWAMTVASYATHASRVALLKLKGVPDTLVVERYDRGGVNWPTEVCRIHQEDACQALGLPSHRKYANEFEPKGNDPTYKAIAELLQRFANDPLAEMNELFCQLVVNMALGNWDAHAKNISFLYADGMTPKIAPLYDVVPIADVEQRTTHMSIEKSSTIFNTKNGLPKVAFQSVGLT